MGLPPSCFYPLQAFRSGGPAALAQVMENFFRSGWDPLVLGGVDGSNAHPNLAGGGLSWSGSSGSGGGGPYPPKPNPPPHLPAPWAKRLVVELADETADARIQKKGAPGTPENRKPGLELVTDPTDTTYGKVCFVAKQDKTKQIGSVIVENPVTVTNPKIDFVANFGKMRVGTTGDFPLELIRNGATVTVEERAGSAAITYDIRTVKFSNGTVLRTLDTSSYTLNNLADILYTLAYDNKTTGTISGWTATASSTYTLDLSSFTANTLAALLATAINDIQTNGYLSVSLYRVTTPRTRFALDCDSFTLNQLGQATCAFLAELGVTGLETGLADKQPLNSNLTSIAALTTTAHGRGLLDDADAAASRTSIGLGTISTQDADDVDITGGSINVVSGYMAVGKFCLSSTPQTASSGGNYSVAANVATVFVDASALTGGQNYDVTLPDATDTNTDRVITVKVTVVGAAAATVTVKSAGGTVEGAAAATGVPLDAEARSFVMYQSDGTNWWRTN